MYNSNMSAAVYIEHGVTAWTKKKKKKRVALAVYSF